MKDATQFIINDGITHINVYSGGRTELGRIMSNFAYTPFRLPDDGAFNSVEGYWYWLSCKDDRLRNAVGYTAKTLGRYLRAPDWPIDPEFRVRVLSALTAKLDQNPEIKTLMRSTNLLPLEHYYVHNGKVYKPDGGKWMIDWWEVQWKAEKGGSYE
jgi:hypothetical protein